MNVFKTIMGTAVVIVTAVNLCGCAKHLRVTHYPAFYQPEIKTVAVLPFENQTSYKGMGKAVGEHLAAALKANGFYRVTGPGELARRIKDKHLAPRSTTDLKAVAEQLAQVDHFQAVVGGIVLSESRFSYGSDYYPYEYSSYETPADDGFNRGDPDEGGLDAEDFDEGEEDFEGFDDFGDYYPFWYYPYPYDYGTESYISIHVSFVRVPDGVVLYSSPVKASVNVSGISESMRQYATQMAIQDVVKKTVRQLAPTPTTISVHPGHVLQTADSIRNDRWHFANRFSSTADRMYVVLCLPPSAKENRFTLEITPRDKPDDIIDKKEIEWSSAKECSGYEFSPRNIAEANGPGEYTSRLSSLGKTTITKDFRIQ